VSEASKVGFEVSDGCQKAQKIILRFLTGVRKMEEGWCWWLPFLFAKMLRVAPLLVANFVAGKADAGI
jgi:hypothetical protein